MAATLQQIDEYNDNYTNIENLYYYFPNLSSTLADLYFKEEDRYLVRPSGRIPGSYVVTYYTSKAVIPGAPPKGNEPIKHITLYKSDDGLRLGDSLLEKQQKPYNTVREALIARLSKPLKAGGKSASYKDDLNPLTEAEVLKLALVNNAFKSARQLRLEKAGLAPVEPVEAPAIAEAAAAAPDSTPKNRIIIEYKPPSFTLTDPSFTLSDTRFIFEASLVTNPDEISFYEKNYSNSILNVYSGSDILEGINKIISRARGTIYELSNFEEQLISIGEPTSTNSNKFSNVITIINDKLLNYVKNHWDARFDKGFLVCLFLDSRKHLHKDLTAGSFVKLSLEDSAYERIGGKNEKGIILSASDLIAAKLEEDEAVDEAIKKGHFKTDATYERNTIANQVRNRFGRFGLKSRKKNKLNKLNKFKKFKKSKKSKKSKKYPYNKKRRTFCK
jgi:hypothetical protein